MYRIIQAMLIASAIVLSIQISAAQDIVGEVTRVDGNAELARGGNKLALTFAMPVAVGD